MKERIVFMGTPEFSVTVFEGLIANGFNVVGVVTQPDKPVGRKKIITPTPLKRAAVNKGIKVLTPIKISEDYQSILDLKPDIVITAAYGQFIPNIILETPKYKAINVHGSLLPKYRGGSPIHTAIKNGDKTTGITIMYMAQKMDSGDILFQREIDIDDDDNVATMFEKLAILGRDLLVEKLPLIFDGNINPVKQDINNVTFAYNIKREEEKLDFSRTVDEVYNHIRGYYPWPTAYTVLDNTDCKILKARRTDIQSKEKIGTIVSINKKSFGIVCGDYYVLEILELQLHGKKVMSNLDFINGIGRNIISKGLIVG